MALAAQARDGSKELIARPVCIEVSFMGLSSRKMFSDI